MRLMTLFTACLPVFLPLLACSSGSNGSPQGDVAADIQLDSRLPEELTTEGTVVFPDVDVEVEERDPWEPDPFGHDLDCSDSTHDTLFGTLCESEVDCEGGAPCLWHFGDKRCSRTCIEECPTADYTCAPFLPPPDLSYACVSDYPSLCLPCLASKDCPSSSDRCLVYANGQGAFCGGQCSQDAPCPQGYECKASLTTEGDSVTQCVYTDGPICPCSSWATSHSLVTSCAVTNQSGTCVGTKSCSDAGWSDCEAQNPQAELCFNQLDDDCNGQVDDPTICNACDCGDGVCQFQCAEAFDPASGLDALLNCAVDCASCGNGFCDPGESTAVCPQDCCGTCGDGLCTSLVCGESGAACPADCAINQCGNGLCQSPENAVVCPADCAKGSCGNATCDPDESTASCPSDCPATCGDCICQPTETAGSCPVDCGFCGDGYCLATCPDMYTAENLASCFTDCCQSSCTAKECGSDGCFGSCGTCPQGSVCSDQGLCVCVPQCEGKQCGSDGCNGDCGQCAPGTKCDFGLCMEGCNVDPDCPIHYECVAGYCATNLLDDALLLDPTSVVTIPQGLSPTLSVALFEQGMTEAGGAASLPLVQLGISTSGWDPRLYPDQWVYVTATYTEDFGNYDLYTIQHTLSVPGQYYFTFRASLDGNTFQYADLDGSANGFDPTQIGLWSVTPPPEIVSASPQTATVVGGDSLLLTGANFQPYLTLKVGGTELLPTTVTPTTVVFVAPTHAAGPVTVEVLNPDGQSASLPSAFTYVRRFTPSLDGSLTEWGDLFRLGTNSLVSNWDASKNKLSTLYAAFDANYMYIAIEGYCEANNYILCYIDMDFGATSGVSQMAWLSDNTGNGDLDDAFSNVVEVSIAGYGADWGFGTKGMASFTQGSDLGGSTYVGWRAMGTPYNLPWFQGTVKCSATGCEAAIPLATVLPGGIPDAGTQVALFAKITDRYGDIGGISNQTLPEYFNPDNVKEIKASVDFLLRN